MTDTIVGVIVIATLLSFITIGIACIPLALRVIGKIIELLFWIVVGGILLIFALRVGGEI
jgi:hypothetical protein